LAGALSGRLQHFGIAVQLIAFHPLRSRSAAEHVELGTIRILEKGYGYLSTSHGVIQHSIQHPKAV